MPKDLNFTFKRAKQVKLSRDNGQTKDQFDCLPFDRIFGQIWFRRAQSDFHVDQTRSKVFSWDIIWKQKWSKHGHQDTSNSTNIETETSDCCRFMFIQNELNCSQRKSRLDTSLLGTHSSNIEHNPTSYRTVLWKLFAFRSTWTTKCYRL